MLVSVSLSDPDPRLTNRLVVIGPRCLPDQVFDVPLSRVTLLCLYRAYSHVAVWEYLDEHIVYVSVLAFHIVLQSHEHIDTVACLLHDNWKQQIVN